MIRQIWSLEEKRGCAICDAKAEDPGAKAHSCLRLTKLGTSNFHRPNRVHLVSLPCIINKLQRFVQPRHFCTLS